MYTRKRYKAFDLAMWTRFETLTFLGIGIAWAAAYYFLDIHWIKIPWTPLALIGTAVAFVIGFQNNSAYGRIWEARKIWGGIVNTSRTFGIFVQDMVSNDHTDNPLNPEDLKARQKQLIYRHIAWMTALRHSMRTPKPWETFLNDKANQEWHIHPPEKKASLEEDLKPYLSKEDLDYTLKKNNKQTALLYLQSHDLKKLKDDGHIWEFSFLQMEGVLEELFTLQGKSERIKNFPYPRQFATLNHFFMWLLILLLPVSIVPLFMEIGAGFPKEYSVLGDLFVWLSVPVYTAVAWIFHTMERIGRVGENPFEGTSNDVPISTIARGIEIDLRQNLGESKEEIPEQFPVVYDIQF